MTLQNTPKIMATNVTAPISGPYLRMADNGMANIPLFVCHHHSGGLTGIFLANNSISADSSIDTAKTMTEMSSSPWTPANPMINGNMAQPKLPQANWRPTSPRPVDVSRVAMIMAAFNNVIAAAGKISATERIIKYDQKVRSTSPTIYN